jgi:hypothetical protein
VGGDLDAGGYVVAFTVDARRWVVEAVSGRESSLWGGELSSRTSEPEVAACMRLSRLHSTPRAGAGASVVTCGAVDLKLYSSLVENLRSVICEAVFQVETTHTTKNTPQSNSIVTYFET